MSNKKRVVNNLKKLEQNIAFIRTKHKLQEELTFEEVTEATAILYAAVQENLDAFVRDVAGKNGSYLRKKMKKSEWSFQHFEVQGQLDEIEYSLETPPQMIKQLLR